MPIFTSSRSRAVVVLAAASVLAVGAGSGAIAGSLITGKDIKDRSIEARDLAPGAVTANKLQDGSITLEELHSDLKADVGAPGAPGAQGPKGPEGPRGPQGPKGDAGTVTYSGANWNVVDRNVIGAADAYLRSGPTSNWADTLVEPPMGVGSLGLRTASANDKTAFGNEVDFQGVALSSIDSVSFWQYTTNENRGRYAQNLASVAMEINPSNGAQTYSTLNYVAPEIPGSTWTKITADEKQWYLTGAAGTATGCNQVTYCTLAEVEAALPDATLYTVQITKGRDYAYSGAVDALQINSTTYDFEPFGVIQTTS